MSLSRTALRLGAIAALNADPAIDGLCLGRVYDSRIGPLTETEIVPVLVVYTEDGSGDGLSANNGGPPFDERCELLVEIAMMMVTDDPDTIALVESDRELEATIDLLESRVVEALTFGSTAASRLLRQVVTRRVTGFRSSRFVSQDTTMKLAMRMLHASVQLKSDDRADARVVPTGEFASLPNPLRTMAESFGPDTSERATCVKLAAALAAPSAPQLLQRFGFRSAPASDAPLLADFPADPSP